MSALLQHLKKQTPQYLALMRVDRPIGTYLVLWPTLWALWFAAGGFPAWHVLIIFVAGHRRGDGKRSIAAVYDPLSRCLCLSSIYQSTYRFILLWRCRLGGVLPLYEALHPFTPISAGRGLCVGNSDGLHRPNGRAAATGSVVALHRSADLDGGLRHVLRDG
jgi:hypothetical protein